MLLQGLFVKSSIFEHCYKRKSYKTQFQNIFLASRSTPWMSNNWVDTTKRFFITFIVKHRDFSDFSTEGKAFVVGDVSFTGWNKAQPDPVCSLLNEYHTCQHIWKWAMLLLVFSLLCLSDTWKLGLIVIRLFKVSELGCSYWYLTMSNWPGIFWHCLQRVLAKVWEVLLVAGPSISSLIVLKQTWEQGICYFQKWMSSNKSRPL